MTWMMTLYTHSLSVKIWFQIEWMTAGWWGKKRHKLRTRSYHNDPFVIWYVGLYHIQGSSSTTSALASIYSTQNSNNSVVCTPLDCADWGALSPGGSFTYIPYPLPSSSHSSATGPNHHHHYATPSTLSTTSSAYPSTLTIPNLRGGFLNNNHIFGPQGNNNLSYYNNLNNNNQPNRRNQNNVAGIYSQQYHTGGRPASVLSTYSSSQSSISTLPTPSNGRGSISSSTGLYHVTNLRTPPPPAGVGPPPAYSFRPPPPPRPESVELQTQLQQLLSLQSNTAGSRTRSPNVQQQTRFISTTTNPRSGTGGNNISNPSNNRNNPSSNQAPVRILNLRQLLLEREQYRQQQRSSSCNNNRNSLTRPATRNTTQNNTSLDEHDRLSLATIQSLINAYRTNCGSQQELQSLPLQSSAAAGNPSLTPADVNRLNAINLLVSTVLNQRQGGGGGESGRRALNNCSSSESAQNRPLLLLLDRVIRASSSFSSSSGSGGESVTSNTTTSIGGGDDVTTTIITSGIGSSITGGGSSSSGGEGSDDITLTGGKNSGEENGLKSVIITTTTTTAPLKIKEVKCKNSSDKKIPAGDENINMHDEEDVGILYDEIVQEEQGEENQSQRQNQIIQIIETSVPLKEEEDSDEVQKCFDVDGDKIQGQDYISSLDEQHEGVGKEELAEPKISESTNENNTQSELSLVEEETNLKLGSKLDSSSCCYEDVKMDVSFKSDLNDMHCDVGDGKLGLKQGNTILLFLCAIFIGLKIARKSCQEQNLHSRFAKYFFYVIKSNQ